MLKKLHIWKIVFLLALALFLRSCPKEKPIFSGPYQALKCGLNRKTSPEDSFIFDSTNGYLYYFDLAKKEFKPLSKRVNKGIYFYSMEELSSRLELNKLIGNKLIIKYIDYLNQKPYETSIINKTINLRWLVMSTVYKNNSENISSRIENCMWVDPEKVNTSY